MLMDEKHPMNPTYTITDSIAAALTRIERARGFLEAATLSEQWIKEMSDRALLLEAHHTTHIEGTQLTIDQSEKLLRGENLPEVDPDDKRELLNYRDAFQFVSESLETGYPISEGMIREIHKKLVEGVRGGSADPGNYRKVQNYVANAATGAILYTPPPAHDVPIMMAELVEWLNIQNETHPILKSGIAQFQLVHVHPFLDHQNKSVTGEPPDYFPPFTSTGPVTTLSGSSLSASTTIGIDPPFTVPSRASGKRVWI